MNRFDLEEAMSGFNAIGEDIDTIMFAYADSKHIASEDDILNMLIGAKTLHEARYQKMWQIFEEMIKEKKIL
jgi:hypothetical protein